MIMIKIIIIFFYYTTQAVRGPITKINQSKCSIAGPIFSNFYRALSRPNDPALVHGICEKPSYQKLITYILVISLWSYNKSLINQACSEPYWENIGPRSFLYGPRCVRSVLSRPRADILPVRPSGLVNKI